MRTLTAIVAAAVLAGGISVASAQSSPSQNAPVGSPNPATSTMHKGSMDQKVTGKSKFCLQSSSGGMNCKFASMEACQKAAKGGQCMPNPKMGTTGAR
jgi:hypothetical protein